MDVPLSLRGVNGSSKILEDSCRKTKVISGFYRGQLSEEQYIRDARRCERFLAHAEYVFMCIEKRDYRVPLYDKSLHLPLSSFRGILEDNFKDTHENVSSPDFYLMGVGAHAMGVIYHPELSRSRVITSEHGFLEIYHMIGSITAYLKLAHLNLLTGRFYNAVGYARVALVLSTTQSIKVTCINDVFWYMDFLAYDAILSAVVQILCYKHMGCECNNIISHIFRDQVLYRPKEAYERGSLFGSSQCTSLTDIYMCLDSHYLHCIESPLIISKRGIIAYLTGVCGVESFREICKEKKFTFQVDNQILKVDRYLEKACSMFGTLKSQIRLVAAMYHRGYLYSKCAILQDSAKKCHSGINYSTIADSTYKKAAAIFLAEKTLNPDAVRLHADLSTARIVAGIRFSTKCIHLFDCEDRKNFFQYLKLIRDNEWIDLGYIDPIVKHKLITWASVIHIYQSEYVKQTCEEDPSVSAGLKQSLKKSVMVAKFFLEDDSIKKFCFDAFVDLADMWRYAKHFTGEDAIIPILERTKCLLGIGLLGELTEVPKIRKDE